jgi:hypothetical protein
MSESENKVSYKICDKKGGNKKEKAKEKVIK